MGRKVALLTGHLRTSPGRDLQLKEIEKQLNPANEVETGDNLTELTSNNQ